MLRRPSLISMVMRLAVGRFESAGARRVVVEAMLAVAAAEKAALTVAKTVTCLESAQSQRRAVAAAVEAEIASTAASLVTCPEIARNPRNQESLVVVEEAAAGASTADRTDTCRVNVLNRKSLVSPDALAVGLLAEVTIELSL